MEEVSRILLNSGARNEFIERNRYNMILYTLCSAFILFVYHVFRYFFTILISNYFFSDGDFSFFLTLGAIVRMFGFFLLLMKLRDQHTNAGVSLKTLELYSVVFVSRLCSILVYEGYLPFDRSGDWVYQTVELGSLSLCLMNIYSVLNMFQQPYLFSEDKFGGSDAVKGVAVLVIPSFLLAVLFHPTLNKNIFTDTAWTFGEYLETVAVLPQFFLLQKINKPVEGWISHFVFSLGLSRLFLFIFWISSFHELQDKRSKFFLAGFEGWFIMFAQIAHLAIMGEFCFYYLLAAKEQTPLIIPSLDV